MVIEDHDSAYFRTCLRSKETTFWYPIEISHPRNIDMLVGYPLGHIILMTGQPELPSISYFRDVNQGVQN